MGVITLKIDDELERKLRAKAGRLYGANKGAISASVEEALKAWLEGGKVEGGERRLYVAKRDGTKVAEALSLRELSQELKTTGTDPRAVVIESLPPIRSTQRMGLRTKR